MCHTIHIAYFTHLHYKLPSYPLRANIHIKLDHKQYHHHHYSFNSLHNKFGVRVYEYVYQ